MTILFWILLVLGGIEALIHILALVGAEKETNVPFLLVQLVGWVYVIVASSFFLVYCK